MAMRLFSCVVPPDDVLTALEGLPRPEAPGLRWVPPGQWHVTLCFYGQVADEDVGPLVAALAGAAGSLAGPVVATVGTRAWVLGGALCLPVDGLQASGEAVRRATAGFGARPDPRPFVAHLTVARARGRRRVPERLAGRLGRAGDPLSRSWEVRALLLVSSEPAPAGRDYRTVAEVPVPAGPGDPHTNTRSPLQ